MDVSVNGDRGIRAAHFLIEQQAKKPALRPLILLIKAVLKVFVTPLLHCLDPNGMPLWLHLAVFIMPPLGVQVVIR